MRPLVKTTGSSGMHVYVAIERGPLQKQVWTFAKAFAQALDLQLYPEIATAEYRIAKLSSRPCARRLQPERLGQDARVGVLRARQAAGDRVDAGNVGRSRSGNRARRLPHRQRSRTLRARRRSVGADAACFSTGRFDLRPLLAAKVSS